MRGLATLTRTGEPPRSSENLTTGAPGYLQFEHRGSPVALRGIAIASGDQPELQFIVTDGVQVPEHRAAQRVQLAAPARVYHPVGDHGEKPPVETITADISQTGALVERRSGLEGRAQFAIELFPDHDPTPIRCTAYLARRTPTHLALKFTDLTEADRTRLAVIVNRHQRRSV
jgi:PilZ domain